MTNSEARKRVQSQNAAAADDLRARLTALHDLPHWCTGEDGGRPDMFSPDADDDFPWPCATMALLAATDPAPDKALAATPEGPHEFDEDVDDYSMCRCGVPLMTHDVVYPAPTPPTVAPSEEPVATGDAASESHWMREEFERAKKRNALIPPHARMVVTNPDFGVPTERAHPATVHADDTDAET